MNRLTLFFVTTFLLLCFNASLPAQEQASETGIPAKSICKTGAHFSDFDFWIGEWNVYSNDEKKTFQGSNSVTRQHKDCLVMENWTSATGGDGSSMSYYDPVEDQWRQLWVAGGYSIDYSGGLNDSGSMILTGKINYYKTDQSNRFRGTWTPNADGSVRQFFERFDPQENE